MDLRTQNALKAINAHLVVKKYITIICYFLIAAGIFVFLFYAINKNNQSYKLVSDFKKNPDQYKTEKIMINPRIKFQYNDEQIYEIRAKRAIHKDEQEVALFDVYASGQIGTITAGELKIDQDGNHLVFSQNPVLILNN